MPSFDIVSRIHEQELVNALENCKREISTRYDFKGLSIVIDHNKKDNNITVVAPDELKLKQVNDLIKNHLIRRKIDPRMLDIQESIEASGSTKRQIIKLKEGIGQEIAKKIINQIKTSKIKVQIKIQGNELRADGKKKDDLQEAIAMIRSMPLEQPVEFINFRD
jgi:uncharacterized protein YajQ (UPF0234 family)